MSNNVNKENFGHKELFNEQPLVISPKLATIIGLNEAIVLQQVQYWLRINMNTPGKEETHFINGVWWTYNRIDQWQEEFPFWGYDTVKRVIASLEKKKILISGNHNKDRFGNPDPRNRTKWYTINYEAIPNESSKVQKAKTPNAKVQKPLLGKMGDTEDDYGKSPPEPSNDPIVQFALLQEGNLHSTYTETSFNHHHHKADAKKILMKKDWCADITLRSKAIEAIKKKFNIETVLDEDLDLAQDEFREFHINAGTESDNWDNKFLGWCKISHIWKDKKAKKTYTSVDSFDKNSDGATNNWYNSIATLPNMTELCTDIMRQVLDMHGEEVLLKSNIMMYRTDKLNGDCLSFKRVFSSTVHYVGQMYQEKILDAVRALKPEINRVEFV